MAYNLHLADRITYNLTSRGISFEEKKMFGGLCYMVDDKMCIGIIKDDMMARINPETESELLLKTGARPMDFTNRPMKGYLYVDVSGYEHEEDLNFWIDQCLVFNPFAKSSKKKKRKT
ncbi:MAG: TfoX/Sxy family protein [Cyanothece sp. SIO1E1]|nr:TfoX/Sxy family protein [Cyanothece sp. SIO1E1]